MEFLSLRSLALILPILGASTVLRADKTLYLETFDGSGDNLLNGATSTVGDGIWRANSFLLGNGKINGYDEGSAQLPFTPEVGKRYRLSLDVNNRSDRWVALGFARNAIVNPGQSNTQDRLSNLAEGVSWMLFRNDTAAPHKDIEVFSGPSTEGQLSDSDAGINFSTSHTISIEIESTDGGNRFMADFLLDGESVLSSGTALISLPIYDIHYACIAFDNQTSETVTVDNFKLVEVMDEPPAQAVVHESPIEVETPATTVESGKAEEADEDTNTGSYLWKRTKRF